jgi:hypothetical protein
VYAALQACVPDIGTIDREQLLTTAARYLGAIYPDKQVRSRLNKAIQAQVVARRLTIDAGWKVVGKPQKQARR